MALTLALIAGSAPAWAIDYEMEAVSGVLSFQPPERWRFAGDQHGPDFSYFVFADVERTADIEILVSPRSRQGRDIVFENEFVTMFTDLYVDGRDWRVVDLDVFSVVSASGRRFEAVTRRIRLDDEEHRLTTAFPEDHGVTSRAGLFLTSSMGERRHELDLQVLVDSLRLPD